jgi:DnaK suppressor protein
MKKARKAAKRKSVKRIKAKRKVSAKAKAAPKVKKLKKLPSKQLKKYKALLLKQRDKTGGDLNHIANESLKTSQRDASGDLSGYSFHMADIASDNYEREFSLGRASDEQDVLYAIDEALKRIDDGTYGHCQQCGKPISKKRLDAMPQTELCISCQTSSEKK